MALWSLLCWGNSSWGPPLVPSLHLCQQVGALLFLASLLSKLFKNMRFAILCLPWAVGTCRLRRGSTFSIIWSREHGGSRGWSLSRLSMCHSL